MQIIIHRGTHQIGGCATEIRSGSTRILIDLGEELNGGSELKINGVTNGTADCDGAKVVYSMWSGYLKESENAEFISGFSVDKLHTSGHADIETIKTVISETAPKIIIPIHTEAPDEFANLVENSQVIFCNDGEIVEI